VGVQFSVCSQKILKGEGPILGVLSKTIQKLLKNTNVNTN
jgi:hypothetical protein